MALDSEQRARISALEEEVDVLKKLRAEEVRELEEQLAGTKAVFEQERSRADKMEKGLQVMRQVRRTVVPGEE